MWKTSARPIAIAACSLAIAALSGACTSARQSGVAEPAELPPAVGGDTGAVQGSVTMTRWGPLTPAGWDLLVKVRQAGLWEIPTGRQAATRAARPRTRRNLGEIANQHVRLDAIVRSVAARLNVPLPNEPTVDQQDWMTEISQKAGIEYDRTAVMRMRIAHGNVYPAIAAVRGSTQNTLIRRFAEQAEKFVSTHMNLLEGTGFVDAEALPPVPEAPLAPQPLLPGEKATAAPPATSLPHS